MEPTEQKYIDQAVTHIHELIDIQEKRSQDKFFSLERTMKTLVDSNDSRYQARFVAQEQAVKDALVSQEKLVAAALESANKAVLVAEENSEKWRANQNEWRAAMTDRERNFATQKDLAAVKERLDRGEGSGSGKKDLWLLIGGAIVLVITIANFWNNTTKSLEQNPKSAAELSQLQKSIDTLTVTIDGLQKDISALAKSDKK